MASNGGHWVCVPVWVSKYSQKEVQSSLGVAGDWFLDQRGYQYPGMLQSLIKKGVVRKGGGASASLGSTSACSTNWFPDSTNWCPVGQNCACGSHGCGRLTVSGKIEVLKVPYVRRHIYQPERLLSVLGIGLLHCVMKDSIWFKKWFHSTLLLFTRGPPGVPKWDSHSCVTPSGRDLSWFQPQTMRTEPHVSLPGKVDYCQE